MEGRRLLVAALSIALLASMVLETQAGTSFHPRPLGNGKTQGTTGRPSTKRELDEGVAVRVAGAGWDATEAEMDLPSRAQDDIAKYRDVLVQLFEGLLESGGPGE